MTEATITIEDLAGSTKLIKIVHVSGQLDESNIDEKIKDVYKLVEANPKGLNLLFDLENLEYMNSKSIGYMTDLYGKITETGGQVVIAKAKPNIIDILQVVGLTQLIKTFDNTPDAQNYLQNTTTASAMINDSADANAYAPTTQATSASTATTQGSATSTPIEAPAVTAQTPQAPTVASAPTATTQPAVPPAA